MNLEFIWNIIITFWQFALVGALIIIGYIINLFDKHDKKIVGFKYEELPILQPIRIPTKDKGFFGAIWMWIMIRRNWTIVKDFKFELNGNKYVIPKNFVFDGASIPKYFSIWLSPTGVLLMGAIIHDYLYRYAKLLKADKKSTENISLKKADEIFRDINIEINGFYVLNYIAYFGLRIGGWWSWRKQRKINLQIPFNSFKK